MRILKTYSLMALFCFAVCPSTAKDADDYLDMFTEAQKKRGFSDDEISAFLKPAKKNDNVLKAIQTPWEKKPWYQYKKIFLTKDRIQAGVKFWKKYQSTVSRASKIYNVAPEIIVSIIGVETFYGRYMGDFNVRDALYTIALYHEPRAEYFVNELGNYMQLAKNGSVDPNKTKGSYAGAMGYGQFMPSSYLHYAVDFNKNGRADLTNPIDAIGSVANYFTKHGWKKNTHVAVPAKVTVSKKGIEPSLWKSAKPQMTLEDWKKKGVVPDSKIVFPKNQKALLFRVQESEKEETYWLGFDNFYVISRYNHSQLYSLAAYLLSQEIKKAY